MARPRIFVSSTYYDLKHIRSAMEVFIDSMGYESVLFESGEIPFSHSDPLDESCYKEIEACHMLVLIIGGRYGSVVSEEEGAPPEEVLEKHYHHFNSITRKEYETARGLGLPIYIFVEKGVAAEYLTYKENRDNESIKYAHVDSVNIFRLIESIYVQRTNNLVREFERYEDISLWLKDQWAGLFAGFLSRKATESSISSLSRQLGSLEDVANALKGYSEKIIKSVTPGESEEIISQTNEKLRHKKELDVFLSNDFISHLVVDHLAMGDRLFDAFVEASSYVDFCKMANNLMPAGEMCSAFRSQKAMREIARLREILNLEKWEMDVVKNLAPQRPSVAKSGRTRSRKSSSEDDDK
ncbi:DUF4062 domain-containing protein [Pseudomonas sp. Marseille-Q8238]